MGFRQMNEKERSAARLAAFDYLARREHSRKELLNKLSRRFDDKDGLSEVLDLICNEGLQSDERFAESFVHARVNRGQGPIKIAYELRQKGVSEQLSSDALAEYDDEWIGRARDLLEKKFGPDKPSDLKEKQRRQRFVQQRGFSSEICYRLFDS